MAPTLQNNIRVSQIQSECYNGRSGRVRGFLNIKTVAAETILTGNCSTN